MGPPRDSREDGSPRERGGSWGVVAPASPEPGVLQGGVEGGPGQVQARAGDLGFEPGEQPERLRVAFEAAVVGGQLVEGEFAVVAERAVADVVGQAGRVHQVRVATDFLAELPPDLGALQGVGQPGPGEVRAAGRDHLGLGRQPAQPGAVQDAGAVPLEVTAPGPLGRLCHPAGRGACVITWGQAGYLLSEPADSSAARPASRRATGTRNGEQDT